MQTTDAKSPSGNSLIFSSILAIVVGMSTAIYWVEYIHTPQLTAPESHSSLRELPADFPTSEHHSAESNGASDALDSEKLKAEEILGLTATRERMKWRVQEMTELERLEAARGLAALTNRDADTPLEVLIDVLWDRWDSIAAKPDPPE